MITTESTRTRGVSVRVLRASDVPESVRAGMPLRVRDYLLSYGSAALAQDPAGRWVALCSEGVGGDIADPAEWLASDAPTETVDLADYVRTFGARLESNFYVWRSRLTQYRVQYVHREYVIFDDGTGRSTHGVACSCGWTREGGYLAPATAGRAVETHRRAKHQVKGD
jgi:hypothetical protein